MHPHMYSDCLFVDIEIFDGVTYYLCSVISKIAAMTIFGGIAFPTRSLVYNPERQILVT